MGKYDIIVDEMEAKLRPPTVGMKPYEPKVIPLTTGEDMLVREATPEEIEMIIEGIRPLLDHPKDFYDIVSRPHHRGGASGMLRYRVQDEYFFVGAVNGEIAGIVNGRLVQREGRHVLPHHDAQARARASGAQLFAAKSGVPLRLHEPGRGLDRGRVPQRLQALDDRVRARRALRVPA